MRPGTGALLFLLALGGLPGAHPALQEDTDGGLTTPVADAPLRIDRGEGLGALCIPQKEILTFRVKADLGFIDVSFGTVSLTSRVRPFRPALLLAAPAEDGDQKETGTISFHVKGDSILYTLDARTETRYLPQAWPSIFYRYVQTGSENRRREIKIGTRDGERLSSYRSDTSHGAPKGQRIWRKAEERSVPPGTVDLLGAIFLARTLIAEGATELVVPMLDKKSVWNLRLARGQSRLDKTGVGTFQTVEILLQPEPHPDETVEEGKRERFEGLFGLKGSMHLWVEVSTGVPVRITGDLPAGPLTIGLDMELSSYRGTPAGFQTVKTGDTD